MSLLRPPTEDPDGYEAMSSNSVPESPDDQPSTPELAHNPRRIPNFGHAVIFLLFTLILFTAAETILVSIGLISANPAGAVKIEHPKLQLLAEGGPYLITLVAAWFLFPLVWHRTFLDGLNWNWHRARRHALSLIGIGLLLGAMSAAVDSIVPQPQTLAINEFFLTQSDAWLITFFGVLVAPIFEEICFRGFLVPAFAIAYDWLSLSRTPESKTLWQTTNTISSTGLIFSAILSSILFALIHGQQVAYSWSAMVVLFFVALALTIVRIRTRSVAASTIVHAAYNSLIFGTTIIATGGYRHLDRLTN